MPARTGILAVVIAVMTIPSIPSVAQAPPTSPANGPLADLCLLRDGRPRRASSYDTTGGNADWILIPAGRRHVLLEESGAGCIRHIYWTYIEPAEKPRLNTLRGLVLRAYWDGASRPAIEAPLGDFSGVSNGQIRPIQSLAFVTNPGADSATQGSWGFNCYLPMPFASGARIEIENQGDTNARVWYHVDYEQLDAGSIPARAGRLHAWWNRENPTHAVPPTQTGKEIENRTGDDNYVILNAEGNGQFVGYFLTVVNAKRDWWGEGDDMVFIDGESFPPSIHGTGTEEIFGGGACPSGEYTGPYTGFHCIENRAGYRWWGTNGMYRFYVSDPLRFHKAIRVTLEHGHGNDLANDYSSVAFWYQRGTNEKLPPLPPIDKRRVNFGPGDETPTKPAARAGRPPQSLTPPDSDSVRVIENARHVLWIAPDLAGAVVRWRDKALGIELLRGYRHFQRPRGRWQDWICQPGMPGGPIAEVYKLVEQTPDSITLEGQRADGLRVCRTLRLDSVGDSVRVELTLKNPTDHPLPGNVGIHPEFDTQGEYLPELWLRCADNWKPVTLHRRPQVVAHGEFVDVAGCREAALYIPEKNLTVSCAFDPNPSARFWFYFDANPNAEHANLELQVPADPIGPGQSRTLRAAYRASRGQPSPTD